MPCYQPLKGYFAPHPNSKGKYPFIFDRKGAALLPCGKCVGCRLDRSRAWALRCIHEASLYERNCFVTLTYDQDSVPPFGALDKTALQKFFKRLRKRTGSGVRYFACGEYGAEFGRPHFHACIFNYDFPDRTLWSVRRGVRLYVSDILGSLWDCGFSSVGDVDFACAAYVARYVIKKAGEDDAFGRTRLVPETGELVEVPPEFVVMSRGSSKLGTGGIGRDWFRKFRSDVYPDSFVVHQGQTYKPPRYYDQLLEAADPEMLQDVKAGRYESSVKARPNNTPSRLKVREKIAQSRLTLLKRGDI